MWNYFIIYHLPSLTGMEAPGGPAWTSVMSCTQNKAWCVVGTQQILRQWVDIQVWTHVTLDGTQRLHSSNWTDNWPLLGDLESQVPGVLRNSMMLGIWHLSLPGPIATITTPNSYNNSFPAQRAVFQGRVATVGPVIHLMDDVRIVFLKTIFLIFLKSPHAATKTRCRQIKKTNKQKKKPLSFDSN